MLHCSYTSFVKIGPRGATCRPYADSRREVRDREPAVPNSLSGESHARNPQLLPAARTALFMAVIAACSIALLAAQAPNNLPAAPTQKISPLPVASVPANFVLERVVVRDAHDNAITNLRQTDFQVFDNGTPQTIAYFSAPVAPAQAQSAEVPTVAQTIDQALAPLAESSLPNAGPRYTALFFDDYHLQISDLDQTRQAAQQYSTKALGANDQIGIFTASGETNLGFTGDAEKLRAAVSQIRSRTNPDARNSMGGAATPNGDVSVQYTLASLQNLVLRMTEFPANAGSC